MATNAGCVKAARNASVDSRIASAGDVADMPLPLPDHDLTGRLAETSTGLRIARIVDDNRVG
ncbi:hypothetical protein [Burkholderia sp. Ac-20344]|uniref:hypothetical protein n=1 Tax=Burkholderia sp. Ac-20344 TaxID=2703890 RepID=UPI00197CA34C|nr:hypothetical protein [Burkholderia sp. Ac-20344]